MSFSGKVRIGFMYSIALVPFVLISITAGQFDYTMITDSIPDRSRSLMVLCAAIFVILTMINWHVFFSIGRQGHALASFWFFGCVAITILAPEWYNFWYVEHLFERGSSLSTRVVKIDGVYGEARRSGMHYYGIVNPDHVTAIQPVLPISPQLFARWRNLAAQDAGKDPASRSNGCNITVTVEKNGSAERIVRWHPFMDQPNVVSCG